MYLHITTGTIDYLESLHEKNPQTSINARGTEAILYYEDDSDASIFSTNITYELFSEQGDLNAEAPLSMFYIPAAGDGKYSIRGHLNDLVDELKSINGLIAYRIGLNTHNENYILLIKWADLDIYSDFKHTDVYENYLTSNSLKKFRNEESLFGNFLSSKFYYSLKDNVYTEEEKEELND